MTRTDIALRRDVQKTVDRFVAEALPYIPDPGEPMQRQLWQIYRRATAELSAVCGWDSTTPNYDQDQYEQALRSFVERIGM